MLSAVTPDALLGELDGLRALARSLVHGDADAEDLLQETAIAALAHPPDEDRPVRPWLATVLRNRWRMDRRGRSRRVAREQAIAIDNEDAGVPDAIDRARALEKLSAALVALEEPFRTVVVRRYIDGESAADIARALAVPAGTVRWRLKTGLERLRAALDESTPRWQRALLPFTALKGAVVVKAKTTILSLVVLALLLGAGTLAFLKLRGGGGPSSPTPVAMQGSGNAPARPGIRVEQVGSDEAPTARPDPLPGQGRVVVEPSESAGGAISGRVINWSTGEGVIGA
ncbi:MAG TPA: RNA polymerase sigma factor, partial [Kofleriaceae bacterium]|nr:RNA polymerase sigma factor [Kofleriaceae bacterium]